MARLARFVLGGLCEVWIFDVLAPFSVQCGLACQAANMGAASATPGPRVHGLPPYFDTQEGWSSTASSVAEAVSVAAVSVAEEPEADAVLVDVAFDDDEPHEPEPNPSEPPEPEEPLEEPEGPDGTEEADENPFHQKAVELVPGVWLGIDPAVGTTEPAGEPSQEVGGRGANGPLKSPSVPDKLCRSSAPSICSVSLANACSQAKRLNSLQGAGRGMSTSELARDWPMALGVFCFPPGHRHRCQFSRQRVQLGLRGRGESEDPSEPSET